MGHVEAMNFNGRTKDPIEWVSNAPKLDFSDGPYVVVHAHMSMWPDREELNRRMVLSHVVRNKRGDNLIESSEYC
jgi:hypothetical protein